MTERNPLPPGMTPHRALTFSQARLLLTMSEEPGSSLYIEASEHYDYSNGPTFRGYLCHAPCSQCHRYDRDGVSWRLIHALSEGGFIKSRWGDDYSIITESGLVALADALKKWPRMVAWKKRDA